MAITIRTGANGSYKSAYTAYFTIYQALKAGRVVVTNIEGMQPLEAIESRMDTQFPSTAKLLRVTSRDKAGIHLWTHFFCWAPLGALIVIDECQDIYSKNIGFDIRKVFYKPVEEFISQDDGKDGLLPKSYLDFFYSRYVPADMDALEASETDDRGIAEYDDKGRIIYPHSFNEGFMRHRKYNWDIELLSPSWKQIDAGIKECGEQNFFHKGRDHFFWSKRKPFIWKHDKAVTTPVIPKTKDVNLTTQKIPLDAFLLYKSTSTGKAKQAGAMNVMFRSPKVIGVFLLFLACMGWGINEISNRIYSASQETEEATTQEHQAPVFGSAQSQIGAGSKASNDVHNGRSSNQVAHNGHVPPVPIGDIVPLEGIQKLFVTGINHSVKYRDNKRKQDVQISMEAVADDGVYTINNRMLMAYNVTIRVLDECLIKLQRGDKHKLVTCRPIQSVIPVQTRDAEIANISLF